MHLSISIHLVALFGASLVNAVTSRDKACSLPSGRNTVNVSIIDSTRLMGIPPSVFLTPDINGTTLSTGPSFSFYIEHQSLLGKKTRLLFDLGLRKDWENLPPPAVNAIRAINATVRSLGDTPSQLRQHGIKPESINTIIFSHSHFDHVGDLNLFPKSTRVIVGPGFKAAHLPAYPNNNASFLDQTGFDGRQVDEPIFDRKPLTIASLQAVDHFGDGSFYLLSAPGHDYGHLAALARVTKGRHTEDDTFILLAGDSTHHCGAFRPTKAVPLPRNIPNRRHLLDIHPNHSPYEPFYHPAQGVFNLNATEMETTLGKVEQLDARPNVLTVISHDRWVIDVIDFFPQSVNDWKRKGWGDKSRFRFVQDFA